MAQAPSTGSGTAPQSSVPTTAIRTRWASSAVGRPASSKVARARVTSDSVRRSRSASPVGPSGEGASSESRAWPESGWEEGGGGEGPGWDIRFAYQGAGCESRSTRPTRTNTSGGTVPPRR